MSNITFALRGNSLSAYRSFNGPLPVNPNGIVTVNNSGGTGVIGGSFLDFSTSGLSKGLYFLGGSNLPANAPISVLFRASFQDIVDYQVPWCIGGPFSYAGNGLGNGGIQLITFLGSSSAVRIDANSDNDGGQCVSAVGGTFSMSANVVYDFFLSWDGTTNTKSAKLFVNGTNVISTTPAVHFSSNGTRTNNQMIAIGVNAGRFYNLFQLNEFVIWDSVVDPVALGLIGAGRTSFVSCTALDATASTDPGVGNVVAGPNYEISGVSLVGTKGPFGSTDPGVGNVVAGTAYSINGSALVGTKGPFGSTDPGVGNVSAGVDYSINGAAKVGTRQSVTNEISEATLVGIKNIGTIVEST